jgi:hypothetical protein
MLALVLLTKRNCLIILTRKHTHLPVVCRRVLWLVSHLLGKVGAGGHLYSGVIRS